MCFICSWNGDRSLGSVSLCRCIRLIITIHTRVAFDYWPNNPTRPTAEPSFLIPKCVLLAARWIRLTGGKKVKGCAAVETSSVRTHTCILALFLFYWLLPSTCTPPSLIFYFNNCLFLSTEQSKTRLAEFISTSKTTMQQKLQMCYYVICWINILNL